MIKSVNVGWAGFDFVVSIDIDSTFESDPTPVWNKTYELVEIFGLKEIPKDIFQCLDESVLEEILFDKAMELL